MPAATYSPTGVGYTGGLSTYAGGESLSYDNDNQNAWVVSSTGAGTATWQLGVPTTQTGQSVINTIRVYFYIDQNYWQEGQWDYDTPPRWVGAELAIRVYNKGTGASVLIYNTTGGATTVWEASDQFYGAIPASWATADLEVKATFAGGSAALFSFNEIWVWYEYNYNHGYTTTLTPPTTSVARSLVADNLFNISTGTFSAPSTTTPAVFRIEYQTIKPDPVDPDTWYFEAMGYSYLNTVW